MRSPLRLLLPLLLVVGLTGCATLGLSDDDELEITGTVEEVGDAFLVVDGMRYAVTDDTEFDGYDSLADVAVGDEVEVEYEEHDGERIALEVEAEDGEDEDGA